METRQLIITIVGLLATAGATLKAGVRARDLWLDYRTTLGVEDPGQMGRVEVMMTKNRFRGQLLRLINYLVILVLFLVPLLVGAGDWSRLIRTILILFVLIAFAAEEFYLDRARDKWLTDIRTVTRKEADRQNKQENKQDRFLDTAEQNQLKMEGQRDLANSALRAQTNLRDAARTNSKALKNQRKRKSGS